MEPEVIKKIRRRIEALNQPINVENIPNAVKLREPFDQLDIWLSSEDEKAISYRNDLLHGNILMDNGTERTSKQIDGHMLYISAKLFTLISKLILKNSGYTGYIINYSKLYEFENSCKSEEYFEKI